MIMDFQQLLKQAKVKQKVVEKKLVETKTKKDAERRQKELRDIQQQKETNEKLKRLKEAAVKRQLEFKGLHKPSKALPPPSAPQSRNSSSTNSSSKSKTPPSTSSTPSHSRTTATKTPTKKPSESRPTSSTKDTKSPATKKPKPPPKPAAVNFSELMKMAKGQKNGTSQSDQPPRRSSSPLGKSLLEKKAAKAKPVPPRPTPKGGKESASVKVPASPTRRVTVDLTRHPCSPSGSQSKRLNGQTTKNGYARNGRTQPPSQNKTLRDIAASRAPLKSAPPRPGRTEPASRKPPLKKQKTGSVRPTAFYGSAAANILGRRDGSSMGSGPFRYTSTWVDELKEELEGLNGDFDDLSDEDDLDGFVVDSEDDFIDDGDSGDYSSHIRKIFGYDRRRFADETYDDRMMESSFAQQQFEEERSARIGKLEDDEDIRREQAESSRKRKRPTSPIRKYGVPKSKLKQSKLPF